MQPHSSDSLERGEIIETPSQNCCSFWVPSTSRNILRRHKTLSFQKPSKKEKMLRTPRSTRPPETEDPQKHKTPRSTRPQEAQNPQKHRIESQNGKLQHRKIGLQIRSYTCTSPSICPSKKGWGGIRPLQPFFFLRTMLI